MPYSVSTWNDLTGYVFDRHTINDRAEANKEFDYQVKSSKLHGSQHNETVYLINKDTDKIIKKKVIKGYAKMPRKTNPISQSSSLPIGEWTPAHAIRQNADGTVDILREKNAGRRANIAEGFWRDGIFHPIRHSSDYNERRAGEGKKKPGARKKRKATIKKTAAKRSTKKATKRTASKRVASKKRTTKKRAMVTSRGRYWSD